MLIEEGKVRILIDPGKFSTAQNNLQDLDVLLLTHIHPDHFNLENIKATLKNNSNIRIFTNQEVGEELKKEGITFELLENGQKMEIKGSTIEAFGEYHEPVYPIFPPVKATGYLIGKFFYPSDKLTVIDKPIDILALPLLGPWVRAREAIDYAIALRPKHCFPVHDGPVIDPSWSQSPKAVLPEKGINFEVLELGKEYNF